MRALVGDRIKRLREAKNLTQRELASAIHMSPATVFRIEKGEVWPEFHNLEGLAKALDTPIDALFAPDETVTISSLIAKLARALENPTKRALLERLLTLDDTQAERCLAALDEEARTASGVTTQGDAGQDSKKARHK